ncbi:hypothetical protein [Streptomyces sp. NBC_00233]|uniref:hypothetical protein n=1 Tax=Streptomyces sp. NBC_00233 TaxID=2975686 RepID=UPI0022536BBE|nr:hypothetical protein [Streptomyces sp. NBC_00233]MCX5231194.1 hypothetical protein [Streptomyces sp. NBC_00233]
MDIPDWFVWIVLGLTVLQVLGFVPVIRRMSGADPAVRSAARVDLLDLFGNLLAFSGLLLGLAVAESWFRLAFAGFALITATYVIKGVRLLRARRRLTAGS